MKQIAFLLFLTAAACGRKGEPVSQGKAAPAPAIAVQTAAVELAEWPSVREVIGTVRARTSGSVSARLTAYVREVRVNIGDTVRPGQTLLVLESKELETSERQAQQARQEAESTEAEVNGAIAASRAQLELAEVTFRRMQDLFEKKSISHQEFDEAQAKVRLARAHHEMALARRKQLEARIAQAGEAVNHAAIQRGYTTVSAPFAGVITEKRVEPGNLATPGAPLLIIEQLGSYRLEVPVEESLLPSLRRGQRIDVTLEALGRTVSAPISEIVPSIDPSTRSVLVKLDLPGVAQLKSGMSGRARFPAGSTRGVVAPVAGLRQQGSLWMAFVVERQQARVRLVTTGEQRGDRVQILSGLSEGDRVVSPVPVQLADMARVEVRP